MITLEDVQQARKQVSPYVKRTVLDKSTTLSRELGTNVYLKLELFQHTGSFKPRGALNVMLSLDREALSRGVTAVSAGNHAIAVGYAAQLLGIANALRQASKSDLFPLAWLYSLACHWG